MKQKFLKGFTLIELLVVIAIIAFLATIILVGMGYMRAKGRDTARVANMSEVRKALVLYGNNITEGIYPVNPGVCLSGSDAVSVLLKDNKVISHITPDPLWPDKAPGNGGHCYYYESADGLTFALSYYLELDSSAGTEGSHVLGP